MKVAELAPAGTVTVAGAVAAGLPEDIDTTSPDGPAGPDSCTVAVELFPPTTEAGERVRLVTDGREIVSAAVCEEDPRVAVSVALVEALTDVVCTVNEAAVAPAETVTVAGTVTAVLPEEIETVSPDGPAGPDNCTVPIELFPPTRDVGETFRLVTVGKEMVRVAVWEELPSVAVMVAVAGALTADVCKVKEAEVDPAATVTVERTVTAALAEEMETVSSDGPAGPESCTVPVALLPPTTDDAEKLKLVTVGNDTVRVAVWEELPSVAVMVAAVDALTADVCTVKEAEVDPAATLTVAGTVMAVLPDEM